VSDVTTPSGEPAADVGLAEELVARRLLELAGKRLNRSGFHAGCLV
jgi:hypothetical protein